MITLNELAAMKKVIMLPLNSDACSVNKEAISKIKDKMQVKMVT